MKRNLHTSINEFNSSSNSDYKRVIPRDFFNESKLLKCMGQLSLKIVDNQLPNGIEITIDSNNEPFDIKQDTDGNIFISNYETSVNDISVIFATIMNSKGAYPMICLIDYDYVSVFDDDGDFSDEFIEYFKAS